VLSKKMSLRAKCNILQKGGFLTALLLPVLSVLTEVMQAAKKLLLIDQFDRE